MEPTVKLEAQAIYEFFFECKKHGEPEPEIVFEAWVKEYAWNKSEEFKSAVFAEYLKLLVDGRNNADVTG